MIWQVTEQQLQPFWQANSKGLKNVAAGANPMDLKRGIDKAVEGDCSGFSKTQRWGTDSDKIKQIASISANNDEVIGELIATATQK
jgi:chaperonin GroEL